MIGAMRQAPFARGGATWLTFTSGEVLCSAAAITESVTEGHNLVIRVMPDIGAPQPGNPSPPAPVLGDLLFVYSEVRFIRCDVAATTEHDTRHTSDVSVASNVKQ